MKSVTAGNDITPQFVRFPIDGEPDGRLSRIEVVHAYIADLKEKRPARCGTSGDQVLHDLVLPVHRNAPARQRRHVDPAPLSTHVDVDAVVRQAFTLQPLANAALDQEVDGTLLQHPGTDAVDHVFLAAVFDNDRIDPGEMEKVA